MRSTVQTSPGGTKRRMPYSMVLLDASGGYQDGFRTHCLQQQQQHHYHHVSLPSTFPENKNLQTCKMSNSIRKPSFLLHQEQAASKQAEEQVRNERASEHYVRVCRSAELLAASVRAHVLNHVSQRAFVLNGAFFRLSTTFGLHYTMHIPCAHIHHASTPQSLVLIPFSSLPRYQHLSPSLALSLSPTLISTPTKTNKEFSQNTSSYNQNSSTPPNPTHLHLTRQLMECNTFIRSHARTLPSLHPQWHPGTYKYFVVLTAGRTPFSLQEIGGQDRQPLRLLCQPRQAQKPRLVWQMQANTSQSQ